MKRFRKHWWQFWLPKEVPIDMSGLVGDHYKVPTGRVTRVTGAPTYEPDHKVKGGRVVKGMPKSLKKLKEAQDKAPVDEN